MVDRDWLKLAFRDLRSLLPEIENDELLTFSFQDETLSVRSNLKTIVLPAVGENWKSKYSIKAESIKNLPKRSNNKQVEILIRDGYLIIANCRYLISC